MRQIEAITHHRRNQRKRAVTTTYPLPLRMRVKEAAAEQGLSNSGQNVRRTNGLRRQMRVPSGPMAYRAGHGT